VTVAHERASNLQAIGLAIHLRDLAVVFVDCNHVDEHAAVFDQLHERAARYIRIRLILLGRVDVHEPNLDVATACARLRD
jgi:hypothetical protein